MRKYTRHLSVFLYIGVRALIYVRLNIRKLRLML